MNKYFSITLGVIIVIGIIGVAFLLLRANRPELESEIAKASSEFKEDQYFRTEPAIKLVPLLKIGMTIHEVESLLGKPNSKRESDGNLFWIYTLDYSQFISIEFDSNGTVQKFGGAYDHLKKQTKS